MTDDEQIAKMKRLLALKRELGVLEERRTELWRQAGELGALIKQLEVDLGLRESDWERGEDLRGFVRPQS